MSFVFIVVFIVLAGVFLASRKFPSVKEKLATVWAAVIALFVAVATGVASWWADIPIVPPM